VRCRFCDTEAIALYAMDKGCFCHPNDREQALCPQHITSATPIGSMEMFRVLDPDVWEWFVGAIRSKNEPPGTARIP
jgi:hypothetical protein